MPYCPSCRNEFIEGTGECPDCGAALVEALPEEPSIGSDEEDLVEVWRTQGELNAQMIRALLEGSGIQSVLSGESLRLTHGLTVDGLALVRVLVRAGDARRAREIIASTEGLTP